MLGSEASEPGDLSTDRKTEILPTTGVFGTFTGGDTMDWIEQGLTSHQTHYRSYWGRVFMGQMTQPTVSKH